MATIKVFDVNGCKTLKCFSTLDEVPYDPLWDEQFHANQCVHEFLLRDVLPSDELTDDDE